MGSASPLPRSSPHLVRRARDMAAQPVSTRRRCPQSVHTTAEDNVEERQAELSDSPNNEASTLSFRQARASDVSGLLVRRSWVRSPPSPPEVLPAGSDRGPSPGVPDSPGKASVGSFGPSRRRAPRAHWLGSSLAGSPGSSCGAPSTPVCHSSSSPLRWRPGAAPGHRIGWRRDDTSCGHRGDESNGADEGAPRSKCTDTQPSRRRFRRTSGRRPHRLLGMDGSLEVKDTRRAWDLMAESSQRSVGSYEAFAAWGTELAEG